MFLAPRPGCVLAVALAGIAWCVPSQARAATGGADRAAAVPRACVPEIARFCPGVGETSGRSAAICLKPFKTSLSLPCRKAVRGVFP